MDTPKNTINVGAGREMSSSLRERLKKLSSRHSPFTPSGNPTTCQKLLSSNDRPSTSTLCKETLQNIPGNGSEADTPVNDHGSKRTGLGYPSLKDIPTKRLCLALADQDNEGSPVPHNSTVGSVMNSYSTDVPKENLDEQVNSGCEQLTLQTLLRKIQLEVRAKEEKLRKLKMVKMYRAKDEAQPLDSSIIKWRSVCQEALEELVEKSPEPKPTIEDLLKHMNIDPELVQYDIESENFY